MIEDSESLVHVIFVAYLRAGARSKSLSMHSYFLPSHMNRMHLWSVVPMRKYM